MITDGPRSASLDCTNLGLSHALLYSAYNTSATVFGFQSGYSETLNSSNVPTSPLPRPHASCRVDWTSEGFFAIAASSSDSDLYTTFSFCPVLSSCCLKIWLKDYQAWSVISTQVNYLSLTLRSPSMRKMRHSIFDRGKLVSTYPTYRPISDCAVNELSALPSRPMATLPLLRSKLRNLSLCLAGPGAQVAALTVQIRSLGPDP